MNVLECAEKYASYAVETRRKFHANPEVSNKEYTTCRMIREELEAMGLEVHSAAGTGLYVDFGCYEKSGKRAAVRTDIDALKIVEETGLPFASTNGCMHACGHDAHITMALTACHMLKDIEGELNGAVRVLFQPGEENSTGALAMIKDGALDGVDTIYGTHVWPGIPSGIFSADAGCRMAGADFFTIHIEGKSTHGARPHLGIDPIAAAASLITQAQLAVERRVPKLDAGLISFCQIHGGGANNQVPDSCEIGGTMRSFSKETRALLKEIMAQTMQAAELTTGAKITINYISGNDPVMNDPSCAAKARAAIAKVFGEESVIPFPMTTVAEDFSYYQDVVPGVFVWLGTDDPEIGEVTLHNSRFDLNEKILLRGAAAAVQYSLDYLNEQ